MATGTNNTPLVVIVGETASGKSALAMDLARQFNGELICADSWTVYKGFDIGTAKPTEKECQEIPHHLLNVADPVKGFSAVVFKRLATDAIEDISKRGKLPIMVGGTGLYIDSVLFDYGFLPPSSPELRTELNAMSLEQLTKKVQDMGLDTTDIDMRNKRRVIRLIENNGIRPTKNPMRERTLVIGTQIDRENLSSRIQQRVETMISAGLEQEVARLSQMYGWGVEPMKGIGYAEWHDYFVGSLTLLQTKQKIVKNSLDLAKRQRTWFKRNKSIQWVNNREQAVATLTTFLNK